VAANQICSVSSKGGYALFIALDIAEPSRLLGFLEEVVTRFKEEFLMHFKSGRSWGDPEGLFLLLTLTGDVSAAHFAQAWQAQVANDGAARALLGMLHQADVMHTDVHGCVIGQASLLAS